MTPPIHKKSSTTRLPQSLLDQVKDSQSSQHYRTSRSSRKAVRKQERASKKQNKADYFSNEHKRLNVTPKRCAEGGHSESPNTKKPRFEYAERRSEEKSYNKTCASPPKASSKLEEEENAYIAYLESKLGLGKTSKKKKSSDLDDLDDLLNFSDSTEIPKPASAGIPILTPLPSRYVPPHLRMPDHDDNAAVQKLTRNLKGLLNRMSEQNITTIITNVEELYRDHRRHDVTSALTTLIINSISNHSSLLDSFVVIYAAFVSSLHKIIGIDFAANFVQHAVASYEQHYAAMQVSPSTPSFIAATSPQDVEVQKEGKECSNLLVLVSELYNFQVISSVLLFDVIRALLDGDLTEFDVELLLKLLRNSGQQLRQDDPSALKDIINIVQGKFSTRNEAVSSRTIFLIETLTNLKNNKLKRNVTQNQGGATVERMKKFLSNLSKTKHVVAHEPMRVSLEDLRSADSKGKWWLVGAAWGGDPLVGKQVEISKRTNTSPETDTTQDESATLAKLARAQGMNTEIRRGIFIVLMSSDDYINACERLSQLNLTEIQQREIVRVLLHCCGNEKLYNPYYTLVYQQLSRISHSYKITLQYCMWDFLRDLGETNVGGAAVIKSAQYNMDLDLQCQSQPMTQIRRRNIARAYGWWISKDSVSLLVLKPLDFTVLKPLTHEFLKELMIEIFLNSQRSTPLVTQDTRNVPFTRNRHPVEEVFIKASRNQALAMGLVYFLSEAFRHDSNDDGGYSKFMWWAVGVAKATLQSGIDVA